MWQRIQTVFLVLAIISLIISIFIPIWVLEESSGKSHELYALHYSVTEDGVKTTHYFPYSLTAILLLAAATIAFTEIRKFKDRFLQIKLGTLNSVFLALALGSAVYFFSQMTKTYPGGHYGLGLYLPAVAVLCNWVAIRFIRRDEKIVRDSDRLR
jgi:glucan phosphoethanolaminetransferase (alkaline phosphatase superfamily)